MSHLHVDDAWAAYKKFEALESRMEYDKPVPTHHVEIGKYNGRIALAIYKNTQRKLKNGKFVFTKVEIRFVRDESLDQTAFKM